MFQVAGGCGLGALDAAKEKGVWGIGVDADQTYLGPHMLTSAVKKVDVAVYTTIKQPQARQVRRRQRTSLFNVDERRRRHRQDQREAVPTAIVDARSTAVNGADQAAGEDRDPEHRAVANRVDPEGGPEPAPAGSLASTPRA